jgi:hypothetical protein
MERLSGVPRARQLSAPAAQIGFCTRDVNEFQLVHPLYTWSGTIDPTGRAGGTKKSAKKGLARLFSPDSVGLAVYGPGRTGVAKHP